MNGISSHEKSGERVAFLIGAGRSGTTLLYKLLCLHTKLAYLSNYDMRMPGLLQGTVAGLITNNTGAKLKAWFNQGGNAYFIKRPVLKRLFPTPVEGEAIYERCGIPLYPTRDYKLDEHSRKCMRTRFERIRCTMRADVFLSKRTANNRRLPQLESIFPQARYVHLIRDGREVANSLSQVEWWDEHVLWWDGRTAAEMEQAGEERLSICARNWIREMQELRAGLSAIDPVRIHEVRYEKILADPLTELGGIMDFLDLPVTPAYRQAIESLQLTGRPAAWLGRWTPEQIESVLGIQRSLLDELGYL